MTVFNKEITLGFVKEVSENDVLITVNEKEYLVELTKDNREPLFQALEENIFIVPFNLETNEIMMDVNDEVIREMFPETELEEILNAVDVPEEYK